MLEEHAAESSPRDRTPVLRKIALRWSCTVYGETASVAAISLVSEAADAQPRHLALPLGSP